jgi:aryl-alcohol dehydrogenase-like predicted oxidoreductase
LSSGTLSGKYTRENGNQLSGARAAFSPRLSDKQYDIIESVGQVAKERGVAHATVALSWLKSRAGVSSVLLGVTSIAQLDENLKGIDLTLTEAEIARLDAVSVPALNFPAASLNASPSISHAGAMVNGVATQKMVFVPNDGDKRW